MDFDEVIRLRHSGRVYDPTRKITPDDLTAICSVITRSPTAGNLKAYEVHIISDKETKHLLAAAALNQMFIAAASVVFVFSADPARSAAKYGDRGHYLYSIQDATIVCSYVHLAATNRGMESCWIGAFDEWKVKQALNIVNKHLVPVAILPVGYPLLDNV